MDIIILILLMLVIYGLHSNEKLIRMNRDSLKNYVIIFRSSENRIQMDP